MNESDSDDSENEIFESALDENQLLELEKEKMKKEKEEGKETIEINKDKNEEINNKDIRSIYYK